MGLQIEHSPSEILVNQKPYIQKVLRHFNKDQTHPLSTLMIVWSLNLKNDRSYPKKDSEMILGHKVWYLSVIVALLYLTQCTRLEKSTY